MIFLHLKVAPVAYLHILEIIKLVCQFLFFFCKFLLNFISLAFKRNMLRRVKVLHLASNRVNHSWLRILVWLFNDTLERK